MEKICLKCGLNKKWEDWFELEGINGFALTCFTLFIMFIFQSNSLYVNIIYNPLFMKRLSLTNVNKKVCFKGF